MFVGVGWFGEEEAFFHNDSSVREFFYYTFPSWRCFSLHIDDHL